MINNNKIKALALASMFLALALIMPFLTGQIQQIGSMLCPMHIPVLLCGYFCGGSWGFVIGAVAPVLRSFLFGMPQLFPQAICMALELATYGLLAGILHKKWSVYASLITAMLGGRVVWGIAMFACLGFDTGKFGLNAFLAGAVTNAVPGIILQLLLIPTFVVRLRKAANGGGQ